MKTTVSIFFVLFAIVAFVHSTPLPQGEIIAEVDQPAAPNGPILSVINNFANTGINVAKSVAETTGRFIEGSAQSMTNGINVAAHTISETINRPFQSAAQATQSAA